MEKGAGHVRLGIDRSAAEKASLNGKGNNKSGACRPHLWRGIGNVHLPVDFRNARSESASSD